MQNLIIDIGNTAVKAAWADGPILGRTFRYQGEKVKDFILSLTMKERPHTMVVSSVYEISSADEAAYRERCTRLLVLDRAHSEVLSRYSLPEEMTFDRAASIIAVRHEFAGKGVTVIDFGTTLTIDIVNAEGRYLGGNISLGCRTRFKAVNRYSRALPLIDLPEKICELGLSVNESIASGIIKGIMFEIEGYVSGYPENIVVFTGGDAIYFAKRMKNSIFVICNLVLTGLALIADGYVD